MQSILEKFWKKFNIQASRSREISKQLVISFTFKGLSIVSNLLIVPITLTALNQQKYGIWLTLSSVISWVSFFDIGLGNGLRNRIASSLATNDKQSVQDYISTAYVAFAIICVLVLLVLNILAYYIINWQSLLNVYSIQEEYLRGLGIVVLNFFIGTLYFKLINSVSQGFQKSGVGSIISSISSFITLLVIWWGADNLNGDLFKFSFVLSAVPFIVFLLGTLFLFRGVFSVYRPHISKFRTHLLKDVFQLGLRFFYNQIIAIVLFSSTSIIIAHASDSETVASYTIAQKYFYVIYMIFGIYLTPYWSAVTDAFSRQDSIWLTRSMRNLNKISFALCLGVLILFFTRDFVLKLWIGDEVKIGTDIFTIVSVIILFQIIESPYSIFINGIGRLKMMTIVHTVQVFVFIPSAYFLGLMYGAFGVLLSVAIIQFFPIIVQFRQVEKLIQGKAKGIWNE